MSAFGFIDRIAARADLMEKMIDTLGVRGAHIHSAQEYAKLDSLVERAKLSALLLLKIAAGELPNPGLLQEAA